jgi:hypothetical protein
MTLQQPIFIALFVAGGLLSQALPASAIRVKYSIDFFSAPDNIQKVIGENEFRFRSDGTLVPKNKVGSGFFGYDTDNTLFGSKTLFQVDELFLDLGGKSLTLNDFNPNRSGPPFGPPFQVGALFGTLEQGGGFSVSLTPRDSDISTSTVTPVIDPNTGLQVAPNGIFLRSPFEGGGSQRGVGCFYPATRCLEERAEFVIPLRPPFPDIPPQQLVDVYPPFGFWSLYDADTSLSDPPTDQGFFFTSLEEPKQVPEPPAEIIEIFGSLLLFFGTLRASLLKKVRTQ